MIVFNQKGRIGLKSDRIIRKWPPDYETNNPTSMSVVATLRRLRHGPLRFLSPIWTPLGNLYRRWLARSGACFAPHQKIGRYGPFRMLGEFAFSDFENWGDAHNSGFELCIEASRGKACVLDIGAHIGLVSLPLSQVVAPDGKVFAFEPASANRATLERHLELNAIANVEVIAQLVGDANDSDIVLFEHAGVSGMNTRAPVKSGDEYIETRHGQCTLDSFCRERGLEPDVIKIDVEGAELAVLKGAGEILTTARPLLVVSVHPQHLQALGLDTDELHALAAASGYTVSDTNGNAVETFQLDEYVLQPIGK